MRSRYTLHVMLCTHNNAMGYSWGFLGLPGAAMGSWGFLGLSGATGEFMGLPRVSWGHRKGSYGFLGLPRAAMEFARLPRAITIIHSVAF